LNISVFLKKLKLLRAADSAAKRKDSTFAWIFARRRMGHAKRTVYTVAVLERGIIRAVVLIMTGIAHIVRTEATEKGS